MFAPAKGLLARAVFVIGKDDIVKHVEYVASVGQEPNYDAALAAAKSAGLSPFARGLSSQDAETNGSRRSCARNVPVSLGRPDLDRPTRPRPTKLLATPGAQIAIDHGSRNLQLMTKNMLREAPSGPSALRASSGETRGSA